MSRVRLGVLISGRGSNLGALLAAAQHPDWPAEVALVVSNVPDAVGLGRARDAGVPAETVDHRPFGRDRTTFEAALTARLRAARVEWVCLAGFMRVLTPVFLNAWRDRVLNIHPSLLPSFRGLDTHARALAAGVRIHGCTVHLVRGGEEVDAGPILGQAAVPVLPGDDAPSLAARVLAAEHALYPAIVARVVRGDGPAAGDPGRVLLVG